MSQTTVFIIEVKATREEGPAADPACYEDDIRELIDGQEIYPQDPEHEDETRVSLEVTSFSQK